MSIIFGDRCPTVERRAYELHALRAHQQPNI